ncbi:adenylate/guanylate cyclase domain-containing protein [Leptospira brenneri]|uniref:Adenylate/guanylate cyclase domain-containing protein n=1 Tax=Leptospira brenneri TaxID=2023182 RepID=A0A2M9XXS9_9LEPT|nr:adenylate/guanylate cyclase domain-containing protein [Leptospira brenneri]PJZ43963.1 adenylate cyclase [Leptospira brenneri]TGK95633.1 adenylate/guanylate cyclase domain-containing protein [Leptospira brenneri]
MIAEFIEWYTNELSEVKSSAELFDKTIGYLQKLDFRIVRVSMGTRTLHPQVESLAYTWVPKGKLEYFDETTNQLQHSHSIIESENGFLREVRFRLGSLQTSQFVVSPVQYVMSTKQSYYFDFVNHKEETYPYPILDDLAPLGATGYFAVPIFQKGAGFAFLSLVTDKPNGWFANELTFLQHVLRLISLQWINFIQNELTESLLSVYLGKRTGSTVYSGKIYLGELDNIKSVIWFSDIRNYSGMSEKLSPPEIIQLLNDYFGLAIPLIEAHGGEVLKLLGDGILAVFPYTEANKTFVGKKVLLAVRKLGEDLVRHNQIREKEGKLSIHHGVGLHSGEILYGNIGSTERLDFTVIGEAVNLTSRIAGMCGELGKAVLASENLAEQIPIRWEELGEHKLKGIGVPQKIFAISERTKRKS